MEFGIWISDPWEVIQNELETDVAAGYIELTFSLHIDLR